MRTAFYKEAVQAVKEAGYELVRNNNSHYIYKKEGSANIIIPRKMDDPKIYHRILKQVGASL